MLSAPDNVRPFIPSAESVNRSTLHEDARELFLHFRS